MSTPPPGPTAAAAPPPPPPPPIREAEPPPTTATGAGPAWVAPASVGAAAAAGTALVVAVDPTTTHVPLCPLSFATGLDCPLCGSLRAVHSLATGDPAAALDHNLLVTATLPVAVVAWVLWLVRSLGRPALPRLRWPRRSGLIVAVVGLVFFVARNLPALAWLGSGTSTP